MHRRVAIYIPNVFMDVEYYLLEDILSTLIFKEAMRVAISKEEGPGGKGYTI